MKNNQITGGSSPRNSKKTWSRATIIETHIISKTFLVYNGISFRPVNIHENMVGTRLGEYARTRRRGPDPRPKKAARRRF